MSLCKECVSGVEHDGVPQGSSEVLGGVNCYIGTPTVAYPKEKVILFLTDVFGLSLVNNKLLVDAFARNGFKTVLPDYFGGDPVPVDAMTSGAWTQEARAAWKARHGKEVTRPYLDKVMNALTEQGVTSFAATGYCFGARYAVDLALENPLIKVIALSHPSALEIPGDFEALRAASKIPILINSCETDPTFPIEAQQVADDLLGNGQYLPGYERTYWLGCTHGFAVRGDMSNALVKAGFDGAFKATGNFFLRYL